MVAWYIVKTNKFKKKIEALEKEIQELNENNELEEENTRLYNNYEERIKEMSQNALDNNYLWDSQQKTIGEL